MANSCAPVWVPVLRPSTHGTRTPALNGILKTRADFVMLAPSLIPKLIWNPSGGKTSAGLPAAERVPAYSSVVDCGLHGTNVPNGGLSDRNVMLASFRAWSGPASRKSNEVL